ncbi:type VII secretion target [Nocardia sp. NPDC005978]|uniref:type VII secretion target n=1 Tax=Nocardia sp. NPDC005978 TaxID=3156725 RepID=UPI00339FC824
MQVSAQELRDTATVVDAIADGVGKLPRVGAPGGGGSFSAALPGSETGTQLDRVDAAGARALQVAGGRYLAIAGLFRTSADTYQGTDLAAAARFAALGDLNSGERLP